MNIKNNEKLCESWSNIKLMACMKRQRKLGRQVRGKRSQMKNDVNEHTPMEPCLTVDPKIFSEVFYSHTDVVELFISYQQCLAELSQFKSYHA